MKIATAVLATFLLCLLSNVSEASAKWTIFVYMNADNNLEPDAITNINQMEAVGSSADVNIVVEIRRSPGYDFSNGDWSSTRRFLILKDDDPLTISSPPIPWCEETGCQPVIDHDDDLGDIQTFKKAASWLVNAYPAENYAVIFWGHGAGWREEEEAPIFKGMDASERTGKRLTTQDLGEAVRFFSSLIHRPLDLLSSL
jgi:hypothetical protein